MSELDDLKEKLNQAKEIITLLLDNGEFRSGHIPERAFAFLESLEKQ